MVKSEHLRAIVDMGSNGVRFSISDLSPQTARIMPTVFQDRAAISLYDAQWQDGQKQPIPQSIVAKIISHLKQFQTTCQEFGVERKNVRVLATEATREALNSDDFRNAIRDATGLNVELLPKEEEGRVGAMGVASSFTSISGLVMDLGGGSTQLTWLHIKDGEIGLGKSASLPFGAAALSRRMAEADVAGSLRHLRDEIEAIMAETIQNLDTLHSEPIYRRQEVPLLLSGGGFRGWGYTLMDMHPISPYPIPIINGFVAQPSDFRDTGAIKRHVASSDIFRISERRSEQVPAVAFLVQALASALPSISHVRFCQGGVREGALFSSLDSNERSEVPITVASSVHAPTSSQALRGLIATATPRHESCPIVPQSVRVVLDAYVSLLYAHRSLPKEGRAQAALRITTSGLLANAHGLGHDERAALALMLCYRWGGKVSPVDEKFLQSLELVAGPAVTWWTRYYGNVGFLLGSVFPAGIVPEKTRRLMLTVHNFEWTLNKSVRKDEKCIKRLDLMISFPDLSADETEIHEKAIKSIKRVGKRMNWVGGRNGWGIKIDITQSGCRNVYNDESSIDET